MSFYVSAIDSCAAFSDYKLYVRHQETEVWNPPVETYDNRRAPHWWNGVIERTRLPEVLMKPSAKNPK
jgi:hypothetical protein